MYTVTISITGLPAEYSTTIEIDGNDQGTTAGGSSKQFQVTSADSHTFQVDSYISGTTGVRYSCSESSWTLQKSTTTYSPYSYYYPYYSYYYLTTSYGADDSNARIGHTDRTMQVELAGRPQLQPRATTSIISDYEAHPLVEYAEYDGTHDEAQHHRYSYYSPSLYYYPYDYYPYYYPSSSSYMNQMQASHTFSYNPEYMLTVNNPQGQSVAQSGWKSKDAAVTLSTPDRVDKSNVERNIFKSWNIDGTEMSASTITLTMNMVHKATATYQTQYYLDVKSELDSPQGSGWYNQGDEVTVSVVSELPMTGFWGSLGAKYVFDGWSGPAGTTQPGPSIKVTVDKPLTVTASWKADYSTAYPLLAIIVMVVLVAAFLTLVATKRYPIQGRREKKPVIDVLDSRYTKGEITRENYLKMRKDLEKQS